MDNPIGGALAEFKHCGGWRLDLIRLRRNLVIKMDPSDAVSASVV